MLKRFLIFLIILVVPYAYTQAQDTSRADLSNLTKEQQVEVLKIVQEKVKERNGGTTPEQASKWIGLGKEVAELIPVFAEKTGIAADKVLNSFSGKVLLAIVLVHFFWSKIAGILLLTIGTFVWWKWFKNMFLLASQERIVHPNPILAFFGRTKTVSTYARFKSLVGSGGSITDADTAWLVVGALLLGVIVITGLVGVLA